MHLTALGRHHAAVADVRPAEQLGIAIKDFFVEAFFGNAEAVVLAGNRCEVTAEQNESGSFTSSKECNDRSFAVVNSLPSGISFSGFSLFAAVSGDSIGSVMS